MSAGAGRRRLGAPVAGALLVGALLLFGAGAAEASLINDQVTLERVSGPFIPGEPVSFPQSSTKTVTGGIEWQNQNGNQVDISEAAITLRHTTLSFLQFTFGEGSDWLFRSLDWVGEEGRIVDFSISFTPNLVSLPELFQVTIIDDGHGIRLFNTGTNASDDVKIFIGGEYTINLVVEHTEMPEPASLALFGLGLAGLGFGVRRRRAQRR